MTESATTTPVSGSRRVSAGYAALATTLSLVAGFVDAAGYVALSGVYTANMSGNTVLVGVNALGGGRSSAALHAYTIGMFLLGLTASGVVIEIGLRYRFRRIFAAAMALEVLCLGAVAALGVRLLHGLGAAGEVQTGGPLYVLVALLAVAMGAQNTSLRMAGVLTLFTTHVTGTITKLSEDAVQYVFARLDRRRDVGRPEAAAGGKPPPSLGIVLLSVALWLGFLAGALLAGHVVPRFGTLALALPIAALAVIGVIDCIHPLAAIEGGDARARRETADLRRAGE